MAEQHTEDSPRRSSTANHEHGISINLPDGTLHGEPSTPTKKRSSASYHSPMRHHQRTPSRSRGVKETLNAHSHYGSGDDDGAAVHRINQYVIKQEIGRGSFGSVHLAVDQYGQEYAVKEFSKSRLRKRAQSNLLRRPNPRRAGQLGTRFSVSTAIHRLSSSSSHDGDNNSLNLIKEEIAIMKKLDHTNLVSLIEVLDDPGEDSLYMVLEICKKGVAMKVGLDERAEPYDDNTCRCWFRDMILGIEYLHAQGIIHRDIKPDNCLITNDDVLKIVDFGVSEMFEKASDMSTAKSAGSPAFMPPELCVAKHGAVSGRAVDIWSMGVTLYCFRYGRIPFEKSNMLDLYQSIREDDVPLEGEKDPNFSDLMRRMLDKNPETRITMEDLRRHPWVTHDGTDELLSAEENCATLVEPPTEQEMNHAITGNVRNLFLVLKAAKRFKAALIRKHPGLLSMFDQNSNIVAPPGSINPLGSGIHDTLDSKRAASKQPDPNLSKSIGDLRVGNYHDAVDVEGEGCTAAEVDNTVKQQLETQTHRPTTNIDTEAHRHAVPDASNEATLASRMHINAEDHAKGHAHDPLEDHLYLHIGCDPNETDNSDDPAHLVVSESPSATDTNVYEQAYRNEMDRIVKERGQSASLFMNRRVDDQEDIRRHRNICDAGKSAAHYASNKVSALSARGYSAGVDASDAGKDKARDAINALSTADWHGGKEKFKSAVQATADLAMPTAKRAANTFAGVVSTAQSKRPGDSQDS